MKNLLIGLSLSLLSALSANLIVAARASAQEKVRIGISSLGPGFIPSIVAEKKGLYLKYGLSTEHVVVSLAIAMNALGTGDLDYAESIAQAITAAARGFPVKLVMFIQDRMDMMLIARPEIKTVADLRGKTVAISYPGSTSQLVAETILRKSGLEP
jgi:NitT/TauT family transport system substrate-binding protein